jgi:hypothetical protein
LYFLLLFLCFATYLSINLNLFTFNYDRKCQSIGCEKLPCRLCCAVEIFFGVWGPGWIFLKRSTAFNFMPKKAAKKSKALSIAAPGANGDLPLHGGLDELINLFDYRLSISEAELDAARAENEPKHIAACRQDRSSILTSLSCLRQAAAVGSAELPPQVVQWEARLARAEAELDAARIEGDQRTMAACRQDLSSILVSLSYLIQQQYPSAIFGGPRMFSFL